MAKFSILPFLSRKATVPITVNYAGGLAFAQTAKLELVSIMLTTFLEERGEHDRNQFELGRLGKGETAGIVHRDWHGGLARKEWEDTELGHDGLLYLRMPR